jgi:LacI family transcriptional regulator
VTLRDVAEAAGVHVSTVSRVLSPEARHLVNEDTATRIDRLIDELGYSPNRLAQGLKTRRSMTAGVLVNDITNPVFTYVVRGIEDTLASSGYTALVANTDDDPERERVAFDALAARQVDGFIVTTAPRKDPMIDDAIERGVPLVLAVRRTDLGTVASVTSDERAGTRLAVEHLADLGHRRIACIHGPKTVSTGVARFEGFMETMKARRLDVDPALVVESRAFRIEDGEGRMRDLLAHDRPFTAVIVGNDMQAVGCLAVLAERGLRCPEDISIVGFNDMPLADRLSPALTTLRVPYYDLGRRAAELLAQQLDGSPGEQVTLRQELIVRGSTGPPRG